MNSLWLKSPGDTTVDGGIRRSSSKTSRRRQTCLPRWSAARLGGSYRSREMLPYQEWGDRRWVFERVEHMRHELRALRSNARPTGPACSMTRGYVVTVPNDVPVSPTPPANERWWQTDEDYYWPPNARREDTLDGWIEAFAQLGFQPAALGDVGADASVVAIYADPEGLPTHVARRMPGGSWSSKLGEYEDITHELSGLEGDFYGSVAVFLSRPSEPPAP